MKKTQITVGVGTCTDENIIIPRTYRGLPVTHIGDDAFEDYTTMTSLQLTNNIQMIERDAFYGCRNINKINFLGDVNEWATILFETSSSNPTIYAEDLYIDGNLLTEAVLTDIEYVSDFAFYGCNSLSSVTIPVEIKSIGVSAFYLTNVSCVNYAGTIDDWVTLNFGENWCLSRWDLYIDDTLVTQIIIDSATRISAYAFEWLNTNITKVSINDSIEYIGANAFNGAIIPYNEVDGVLYLGNETNKHLCLMGVVDRIGTTSVQIQTGCRVIASKAFYLVNIEAIEIPEGIVSIGDEAFYNCKVSEIKIPNSCLEIGNSAFALCSELTAIDLGNISKLGAMAFLQCTALQYVNLPDSLTEIQELSFAYCENLTTVTIGAHVTIIGQQAFLNCSSLQQINFPEELISIGENAFQNCTSLLNLTIPEATQYIGNQAFRNCTGLESIVFNAPNCADFMEGNGIFESAGQNSVGIVVTIGKEVDRIPAYLFNPSKQQSRAPKIIVVSFEDGSVCSSVGTGAFYLCQWLEEITLPSSLLEIEDSAFRGCKLLSELTLPNGLRTIGNYAFYDCQALAIMEIGANVERIGDFAFAWCYRLQSVDFSNVLVEIGEKAFYQCSGLKTLNYGGSSSQWEEVVKGSEWNNGVNSLCTIYCSDGTEIKK